MSVRSVGEQIPADPKCASMTNVTPDPLDPVVTI